MRTRTLGTRERMKWVWDDMIFDTLKETKNYINGLLGIRQLLFNYEGYDIIERFNKEGYVDSVVRIVPDKNGHHYTRPSRTRTQ